MMRWMMRFFIMLVLLLPAFAYAAEDTVPEEIIADLSQNKVSINTNFDGSNILVFGAIKRETPVPSDAPLGLIITISGPSEKIVVRRKSRVAGIWVNTDAVRLDKAPSFYAVSTNAPVKDVLTSDEDHRFRVTIRQAIRSVWTTQLAPDAPQFTEALIRQREDQNLYQLNEGGVKLAEDTLFRSTVALPSNLVEGNYSTRIFLTRNGRVVSAYSTNLDVRKVGMERWIFNLAHQKPLYYGLLSILIAVAAGWGASTVFRYIRS